MWLAVPEQMRRRNPTPEQMIEDVLRVAEKRRQLNADPNVRRNQKGERKMSTVFYTKHGKWGHMLILARLGMDHFGVKTWTELKRVLGLEDV